ncbi:alpha-2-macroglobulin family protein [Marinoscillum furvescens]|uniref:Alpha-2-macroglobulin family protein n=1 Tax=Marinoscillum furvescens DSM 4134 TaxID=1122208 RepID=A0A3D9L154_MARFU|nr:Ig-like domain-containing alpha-2-macroglobulin family protein [Marinoscillum furvescens]RED95308.1 hypothetical protein C7460_11885 [Marinoscillum furvescens DSM 4134]
MPNRIPHSLLLVLIFLGACSGPKQEQPDTTEIKYSKEIAEIISEVTAGTISPYQSIEVVFNEAMVPEDLINQPIDNPFTFSPKIPGETKWISATKLRLTPESPLTPRTNYSGKLSLESIDPELPVKEIALKFYVHGNEIGSFNTELEVASPTHPNKLVLSGKLTFTQPVKLEDVQNAASLTNHTLSWNQESSTSLSFSSSIITRGTTTQKLTFEISRSKLNLSESLIKTVDVVPLNQLKVQEVVKDESDRTPKILLRLSDQLDPKQSIDGFIQVTPDIAFSHQKQGKHIILTGDFRFGTSYEITVQQGIKSKWGTSLKEKFTQEVKFSDILPQVQFGSKGMYMPTSNGKNLQFMTANVRKVHVEIKRIFNRNIDDFFGRETLKSGKNRSDEFRNTYLSSVGAIIYNQTLEIGEEKNQWLLHNLSLDHVLDKYKNGFYLIRINFNPDDALVKIPGNELQYIQQSGHIFKPLTISDIGLMAKRVGRDTYHVFTTDLITGQPMAGVKLTMTRYDENFRATTNSNGHAVINGESYFTLLKATKGDQTSVIKPYEMQWNTSGFDVGGLSTYDLKTRAYTYTERGVYRPGDTINLSCIVRYRDSSGGSDIPADLHFMNPEGTTVLTKTQKGAHESFYNFLLYTDMNAGTGTWNARIRVGNEYFYHPIKIETVVANKLKVKVSPETRTVLPDLKQVKVEVESRYLFGATADGLKYETEVELFDQRKPFPKFKTYSFFDQNKNFEGISSKIQAGNLNEAGKAQITWNIPDLSHAPAPLKAKISAAVSENEGRPNDAWAYLDVHPFSHYVGIEDNYSYTKLNTTHEIPVVLVDHTGEPVAGKELVYRIYRNDSHWWYQYDNYQDFQLRFKSDKHSYLVEEGTITSGKPFATLSFQPTQKGKYLIEIQDGSVLKGHTSSVFKSAYPYGSIPTGDENAGTLALRSEKETYQVGEQAIISFPSPRQGNVLITVERGDQILFHKWVQPVDKEEMTIKLPIKADMTPNVYVTITALQSHSQTINDRPIRMFGILPLTVIDPNSKQDLTIEMPDELEPDQDFEVNIANTSGKQTQFTIAIVDEGLLDLTNFDTPNPWKEFFKKIRLDIETYDLYGHVIGANAEDVFKTFSIGGDGDYRESQLDPFKKKKRFKPVCMFKGPLLTDESGKATVKFKMPNYVGSVRVMVVSAKGHQYGSAEKTVPVRSDLILQPTIPRALKPGDEFAMPVNVFATKAELGKVNISVKTEGPLEVIGQQRIDLTFTEESDQLIRFKLKVKEAVGQAKITIVGSSDKTKSNYEADIAVSPGASRVYTKEEKPIKPGETITFKIPRVGLDGTNNARLQLAIFPNMDFMHRLDYLINYPYGCIEQTTSGIYAQLALKGLFIKGDSRLEEIDKNIDAGISRLRAFQLSNGSFSYWPGSRHTSDWGSNYAAQFLVAARKAGYVVPNDMYDGILRYLDRQSRRGPKEDKYLMTRVNRCLVLASAGKAPLSEMNLLRQNSYEKLSAVQKWQLVTAYHLAGASDKIENLTSNITMETEDYREFGHTYGSGKRDMGIILQCLVALNRLDDAQLLAKQIARMLSARSWYSTQTTGQMLLGIAHYFEAAGISTDQKLIIEGTVGLPNGKRETIKSVDQYKLYINEGYGEELSITLGTDVAATQLYASLAANGVPLYDQSTESNSNIQLDVEWYDEEGNDLDISQVKQGATFYGRYTVSNISVVPVIEEVALVQQLPSGWEIENTHLNDEVRPQWMNRWNLNNEEYLDIRDDRIMWFFDLEKQNLDFVVKINAITTGTFQLPGARAEAMYDRDYMATEKGMSVSVEKTDP